MCAPMTVTIQNAGTFSANCVWNLDPTFPCPGSFTVDTTRATAASAPPVAFSPADGLHGPPPVLFLGSPWRVSGATPFLAALVPTSITYTPFNGSGFDPPVTIFFDAQGHQYIPGPLVNGGIQDLVQAQTGGSGCTADLPQSPQV